MVIHASNPLRPQQIENSKYMNIQHIFVRARFRVALFFVALMSAWNVCAQSSGSLVEYYGVFEQGGIVVGKASPNHTLTLNDTPLELSSDGVFVFGFGRDAAPTHILKVKDGQGKEQIIKLDVTQREYNIQRVDGVPSKTVTPPPEALERIRKETASIKSARSTRLSRLDFLTQFRVPSKGRVTGVYGSQRVYNGVPKRPHYGIDYAGPVGGPVTAPADGVVTLVHPDMYYSGGTLIVDHGYGLSSTFIHLSEVLVKPGDEVKKGDLIAKIGQGGRSTGPHLDWRMNWKDQRIDPALVMQLELPEDLLRY